MRYFLPGWARRSVRVRANGRETTSVSQPSWFRYGVAVLAVGLILLLRLLPAPPITPQSPFLLGGAAVMVAAWFGGLGPGLLATALGTLAANYFSLPPQGSFTGLNVSALPLALFAAQGVVISSLAEALRAARRRAEASELDARNRQEELRRSEERFRLMVQGVQDYAIFMLNPEGRVASWNEGAERIEGYAAKEIVGEHFSVFYTREDAERSRPEEALRVAMEDGRYEEEGERVRNDGSRFWANALVTALRDELGNLRGFSMVLRDITERKRSEATIRRSLDALLALYETGQLLSSSLEREEIGSRLLGIIGEVPGTKAAVINLGDHPERLHAWRTIGPEDLLASLREEPEARAARREAFETEEERLLEMERPDPQAEHLAGFFLPLRVRERVIGVLEVYSSERLSEGEALETFASVANQAASALENARLYEQLAEHRRRLQDLVGKLVTAQEEERRLVAYEVHDGLAQVAAAAYQHLQNFAADDPPSSTRGEEALDQALGMLQQTVEEARNVVAYLRPTVLDDFGLATALRLQVERLSDEGLWTSYEETLGGERLPEVVETALFRVAQEALTNVRKHARADRVHVALELRDQAVLLEVRDWGRGFAAESMTDGAGPGEQVGLSSMRERVALLGGRFEIRSEPGAGTVVVAEVPLRQEIDTEGLSDDGK